MTALIAFMLIFIVYAIGDTISTKTKGTISMMLFAFVFYLIGFWTFLPKTFFDDSGLTFVSGSLVAILMVHMGTTIKLRDFKTLWKTVVVALFTCVAISLGVILIAPLFVAREYAIVAGPVVSGAIVAALIMQEAAQAIGRADLVVFVTVVLVMQNFVGIPIASFCLKKEARLYLQSNSMGAGEPWSEGKKIEKVAFVDKIPKAYLSDNAKIAMLMIVAVISYALSGLTGGKVNALVICLVLGLVFKELGFLQSDAINKANGSVFVMAAAPIAAFKGLVEATPQMLLDQIYPLIVVFVVGVLSMFISAFIIGKILNYSWYMSTAIASSALFGFPTTYILANEISTSVGTNDEEKDMLRKYLQPNMVIAGIISVSITSVLIAGVVANML